MIQDAPTVKISGKKYDFYSLDFQNNGSESPSTMVINYVNSEGIYSHIGLADFTKITEISVYSSGASAAAFTFRGFPVSSKISKNPGQTVLSVKYIDESNILDNKIIGLKGKFGEGFSTTSWGSFQNIILLGKEVNECLEGETRVKDNCSPCLNEKSLPERQYVDCVEQNKYRIRDVVYKFSDLISAIRSIGIKVGSVPSRINDKYYARYTGTIREVLNNWCDDYAISFHWDYSNGIQFIDLKDGVTINDSSIKNSSCRILGQEEENSIERNKSNDFIAYFGLDGQKLDYSCEQSSIRTINLKPLLVSDLIEKNGQLDPKIKEFYKTTENFYKCCVFSTYSKTLRDMFVLYEIYGIKEYADVLRFTQVKDDSTGSISKKAEPLPLLGNMKILRAMGNKDSGNQKADDQDGFYAFMGLFPKEKAKDYIERKMMLVIAEKSQELYDKLIKTEEAIGKSFIGQYWYRFYSTMNKYVSADVIAPDGDVKYYKYGDEMQFDFLSYLPASFGIISEFIKEDKKSSLSTDGKASDNFIMMKRAAAWLPEQNSSELQKSIEEISKYSILDFGSEDFMNSATKDSRMYGLFLKPNNFEITIDSNNQKNDVDKEKVNQVYNKDGMIITYGLRSAACEKINIKISSENKFTIFTPSQSFVNIPSTGIGNGVTGRIATHGGYKVIIETSVSPPRTSVLKKKSEYVYGLSGKNKNSIQVGLNYRNVTQDLLKLVKDSLYLENGNIVCINDEAAVKAIIEEFSRNLSLPDPIVQKTVRYTIGGFITSKINVQDGLVSINMRYSGKDGFISDLTFSNIQKRQLNQAITIKEIEKNIKRGDQYHQVDFNTHGVPPSDII